MLRRRRDPLVLALRMLSSSSSSYSANPKPLLYLPCTSPIPRLSVFHHHHCSSFSFSRCLPRTQSMTISRCFFSGPIDLIPLSQNHEPGSNDPDSQSLVVVSFYKFADFPDYARLRTPLKELCQELVHVYLLFLFLMVGLLHLCLAFSAFNAINPIHFRLSDS